jgi:hypothetical protein
VTGCVSTRRDVFLKRDELGEFKRVGYATYDCGEPEVEINSDVGCLSMVPIELTILGGTWLYGVSVIRTADPLTRYGYLGTGMLLSASLTELAALLYQAIAFPRPRELVWKALSGAKWNASDFLLGELDSLLVRSRMPGTLVDLSSLLSAKEVVDFHPPVGRKRLVSQKSYALSLLLGAHNYPLVASALRKMIQSPEMQNVDALLLIGVDKYEVLRAPFSPVRCNVDVRGMLVSTRSTGAILWQKTTRGRAEIATTLNASLAAQGDPITKGLETALREAMDKLCGSMVEAGMFD